MNADEARRIYEDIVRRHRDPALVEWMGHGLLRARIFPINPGEEKRVVVRFQSVAQREGDALRIDYVRGTEPGSPPVAMPVVRTRINDIERTSRSPTVQPDVRQHRATTATPYSPTHSARRPRREWSPRRSNARWRRPRSHDPAAADARVRRPRCPCSRIAPDTDPALRSSPSRRPRRPVAPTPRDVTFVIDVSGSMRGEKMEQAKAAGHALLASLARADRFRLDRLLDGRNSFRDDFVDATPENIREARRYLDGLRAEGSTNISGALRRSAEGADRR